MLKWNQDLIKRVLLSVFLTGFILIVVLLCGGYVPFGEKSLATMDASIQYLDFFSFLKDVLSGKNNIFYSFSKMLGGSYFSVFSYYLASPFNFLVVFFEKDNYIILFHILVVLKLMTAGATFSAFLYYRFGGRIGSVISTLLSAGFALSQYNLAQASNIMWLDGVYLLPLILLGVYKLVRQKKGITLAVTVALSLLFNWYTGCINCLFSAFWLVYELILFKHLNIKKLLGSVGRYAVSMLLGIMISGFLFLPSVVSLLSGRGSANWELLSAGLVGSPVSILTNYELGGLSDAYSVSFYVGSLAILGFLVFFFSKKICLKDKLATLGFAVIGVAMYYWIPLYFLFSLLKSVTSYWSRYSYLGCFFILFVAASYFAVENSECEKKSGIAIIVSALLFLAAKVAAGKMLQVESDSSGVVTIIIVMVVAALMYIGIKFKEKHVLRKTCTTLIIIVGVLDLTMNTYLIFNNYSDMNGQYYKDYVNDEEKIVAGIKDYDTGDYRISDLYPRGVEKLTNLRANYNEAAAFAYWSISSYDSDPDEMQRAFLDRAGYRINGENLCVVNTSILPVDSLLGVKYVLSDKDINGLIEITEVDTANNKKIYENPYALPMMFTYKAGYHDADSAESPFEYINELYSRILGEYTEVFKRAEYQEISDGDSVVYELQLPENRNIAVYGNITWNYELNGKIYINNEFLTNYSQWLSPSVFYISDQGGLEATVRLETAYVDDGIKNAEFYYVDLDVLEGVTNRISTGSVHEAIMENGKISCVTEGEEGEYLFLSVPYDEGWEIKVNGKQTEQELFGDCLINIPLKNGENRIEMTYHVQGLKLGGFTTALGLAGLTALLIATKKKSNKQEKIAKLPC